MVVKQKESLLHCNYLFHHRGAVVTHRIDFRKTARLSDCISVSKR